MRRGGGLEMAWRRVSLQMVVAAATAGLPDLIPISRAFTTSHDRCCRHTHTHIVMLVASFTACTPTAGVFSLLCVICSNGCP